MLAVDDLFKRGIYSPMDIPDDKVLLKDEIVEQVKDSVRE